MARYKVVFSTIAVMFVLCSGQFSQAQETPAKNDNSASRESHYLSLDEVSRLAISNNFDIQLARYDMWIASTDEAVAESIYDTMLKAEAAYHNDQRARSSTILGTKVIDTDYDVGLSKKLPTGTTIDVDMVNNRNSSDSPFSTSPLTHDSSLSVGVKQELGRNYFGMQDRGNIKLTLLDIEHTEYSSLEKIEQSLADVQMAYWDLVVSKEFIAIEQGMAEQSKRLYDLNQEKLEDGLVEMPEAIASDANYRERLNELILAQNNYEDDVNLLKLQLNIDDDQVTIIPKEKFDLGPSDFNLNESLKSAFDHRQDYKTKLNAVKSKKLQLSMDKNNLWPEINVSASLARNGLGDHFSHGIKNISDEDNPDLRASLAISFPLENTEARAKLKAAEFEKAKAILDLKYLEHKIAIAIKDQVRNCQVLKEVALNQDEIARLQSRKLEEEQKRYHRGRSDTDTLIRFQEDVLQAQRRSVLAKKAYYHARIELKQKEGILLNEYWGETIETR